MRIPISHKTVTLDIWRAGLIALAIVASFAAGLSFLLNEDFVMPLFVSGAVVALGIGVAWLRKPVWALYAAIWVSVFPEGILSSFVDAVLSRLTLVLALGVWILAVITQRRRIVWTTTTLLMIGFIFWATLTLFWAADFPRGIEKIMQYTLRLGLFLVLLLNEVDSGEALDGLMKTLALNGWAFVVVCIVVFLLQGYQPGSRMQIFNMNSNGFAEHLIIGLPGVMWQVIRSTGPRRRFTMVLSICYILLSLVLTALSGSRGGAISMLGTLATFWIWKPTRPWGKLGVLILMLIVIATPLVFSTVVQRFSQAEEGTLGGREPIWQAGWALIRDHFWGGVGIGNTNRDIIPYLRLFTALHSRTERSLHNPVLQIWADTGIVGLLFYLGVLGSAIWSFFRQIFESKKKAYVQASYFALVSCMAVGILLSWIKGGGQEHAPSYFLLLALLVLPSCINLDAEPATTRVYAATER